MQTVLVVLAVFAVYCLCVMLYDRAIKHNNWQPPKGWNSAREQNPVAPRKHVQAQRDSVPPAEVARTRQRHMRRGQ